MELQSTTEKHFPESSSTFGHRLEDQAAQFFESKKFDILRRNHWFQRHAEIDLWLRHKKFGTVFVEVKSFSPCAQIETRLGRKQKLKLLRIARSLEALLWLAMVTPQNQIMIYDVFTGERIEC